MTAQSVPSKRVPSHNARSAVSAWCQGAATSGGHPGWGAAAQGGLPSELNFAAADAMDRVRVAADQAANDLVSAGFLAGHAIVRELRDVASAHAARVNRMREWAADLALAEGELPSPTDTTTSEES